MGFGVKPQDLTGVRGVLVPGGHRSGPTEAAAETAAPAFPYFQKRGDVCPPLGTAQKPLPQGLREGNVQVSQKSSVYAGSATCTYVREKNTVQVKIVFTCTLVQMKKPR